MVRGSRRSDERGSNSRRRTRTAASRLPNLARLGGAGPLGAAQATLPRARFSRAPTADSYL